MIYLCFFYVLHLRFIYDLRFLWFCIYVFLFYLWFFLCFLMVLCTLLLCVLYDFPLPGLALALETHGFAKEILGKELKTHEFPREA